MAWIFSWIVYLVLLRVDLLPWLSAAVATAVGALASVLAGTLSRRIAVAVGFPLSLLLFGAGAMPGWAWLLPLVIVLLVYPMNAWRDAPLFPTPAAALRDLPVHAPLRAGALVLDAGCGLGHGIRALRAVYPDVTLHGTEWSWPLRIIAGLLCPWARIQQGDMWRDDWSRYDMVYLFQRPETMPRAIEKATAEMKAGAYLVSLEFVARALKPEAVLQTLPEKPVWIYRAPFKAQ
ncbi:MAG: class I SAM-dependent methyltransferase [Oxalobacteraceae bacterium]